MKDIFKTVYPLVVIAVLMGLLLGLTYQFLSPVIEATRVKNEQAALKFVMPAGKKFTLTTNQPWVYYRAEDAQGNLVGIVYKGENSGYGGAVPTLVGIGTNAHIDKIFILSADQETPGLGYNSLKRKWQDQYTDLTANQVPMSKSEFAANGIDALSGATITSLAVTKNLSDAFKCFAKVTSGVQTSTNGGQNEE